MPSARRKDMKTCKSLFIGVAVCAIAISVFGCGGGSSTLTLPAPTPIGSGGGTAQDSTKIAKVTIPAGALSQSTNITVAAVNSGLPSNSQLVPGTSFNLGPSGTNFATPATLTIGYDPNRLPAGATQSTLGLFTPTTDGKDWQQVTGSTVDTTAHTVTGQISHFGNFAILAVSPFTSTAVNGTYTGSNSGTFVMVINPSGTLTVNNTQGESTFSGTGRVSLTGATSFSASGSGTNSNGGTFSFTGTFQISGGTVTASGSWTGQQG